MNKMVLIGGVAVAAVIAVGAYLLLDKGGNGGETVAVDSNQVASFEITIANHLFSPAELEIPAGQKVKLIVKNTDPTPEEFESHELAVEKIIAGNSEGVVYVGPLAAGTYPYFGEFNMDTAQGKIIAK